MDEDRGQKIVIDGTEYTLLLSTRATKEIVKRYGDLEALVRLLSDEVNLEDLIDVLVYLITLFANQGIQIHNYKNPDDKKPCIDEDYVELVTSPSDLFKYKEAIMNAMTLGFGTVIESGDDSKNAVVE